MDEEEEDELVEDEEEDNLVEDEIGFVFSLPLDARPPVQDFFD